MSVIVLGAALALFGSADRAAAAERRASSSGVFVSEMNDVQRVKVIVNKSRTFRVDTAFSTIVVGSPDIVDVKSLSDHLIYIQGKQTGTTNVILFDNSMKQIGILDVEVAIDTGNLQQNIQSSTGTRGIRVSAAEGQVVVSGTAAGRGRRRASDGDCHRHRSEGRHRRQRHERGGAAAGHAGGPLPRGRPNCRP